MIPCARVSPWYFDCYPNVYPGFDAVAGKANDVGPYQSDA